MLTEEQNVSGYRNPQWVTRALKPGEAVQIQQALVQLEQRLEPAEETRLIWHLSRLLNHWKSDRTNDENDMRLDDFVTDLAAYSEPHLVEACMEWRRTQKWAPHVADLVALLELRRSHDRRMQRRCRVLLGLEQPRSWERPVIEGDAQPLSVERRTDLTHRLADMRGPMVEPLRRLLDASGRGALRLEHDRGDA